MSRVALIVLTVVMLVAVGFTGLGASIGYNYYRFLVELLIYVVGVSAIVVIRSRGLRRVGVAALAIAATAAIALLLLPQLEGPRKLALVPHLAGEHRGFVLAALGRPDYVDNGIGIAPTYAFSSGRDDGFLAVVRFNVNSGFDDVVSDVQWMKAAEAISIYRLHPP
jgi:hypothetical protein